MARKRMIDPSFWTDEKLGEQCSIAERLLFMGLISNADDEGRGRANPKLLLATIFPYDNMRLSDFKASLAKLASLELIRLYQVEGQQYFAVVHFRKYQTVNRPTPSEIPEFAPLAACEALEEDSRTTHGGRTAKEKEEKRIEVKEKEYNEQRHKYGQYQNVLLSDADIQTLQAEYPNDYQKRIEELSAYVASTGKSYKNHLATLRNWARRESGGAHGGKKTNFQNYPQAFELSDLERAVAQKRAADCN